MKRNFLRHAVIVALVFTFIVLLGAEVWLRKINGAPAPEPDPPQFKYKYVDIYKSSFEKISKDNRVFYRTVPEKCLYESNRMEFPAVKAPDSIRIFILGGSVAEGFTRFPLAASLKSLAPNENFEIINCALGAYDSYRVFLVAREIVSYSPDLVIVLAGNNENYDVYKINLVFYYTNKFLRRSWVYRNLQGYVSRRLNGRPPEYLSVRQKHLKLYEKNIRAIARLMRGRNIPLVLCTVPVNLKDAPPGSDSAADKRLLLASFLLDNKDYAGAARGFQDALKDSPGNQDNRLCLYLLGRAYEGMQDYAKAGECYLKARDLGFATDGAGHTSNEIIRRICRQENAALADAEKTFMQVSPFGLSGRELFYDYCHLHPGSYVIAADCIMQAVFANKRLCVDLFKESKVAPRSLLAPGQKYDFLHSGDVEVMVRTAVWEAFQQKIRRIDLKEEGWVFNEQILSYLKTLYLMNPEVFWDLQFKQDEMISDFSQNPWIKDYFTVKYAGGAKIFWANLLCYAGETYRRSGEYYKALTLFDKSIALGENDYLPYLGKALTYSALNETGKTLLDSLKQAEQAAANKQEELIVQYYKEFLGL